MLTLRQLCACARVQGHLRFPPSRLCTCVFYVREMCSVCKCLCAQRLPSYYVCFTAGQSFTGRVLWHSLRAISVQIYWFIMAKQVQRRMGRYRNSTSGSHTIWRLKGQQLDLCGRQLKEMHTHTGGARRREVFFFFSQPCLSESSWF